MTETKDVAEARADFWSIQGVFIYRLHNEPRVQLNVPKEETFTIPLKYIDVTRATYTNLDVLQEQSVDYYWNVDVNRSLSDSWKGITKFTFSDRNLQRDPCGPGRDKQKFKQLPDLRICGLKFGPKWESRSEERKARKGKRETQAR